jgi:hypothetical protein
MAQNGRLPDSDLALIFQGRLRKDAAATWNAMNVITRRHGIQLYPTGSKSSYRTYAQQEELYRTMAPGMAARPGTSNHGWGLAVDVPTVAMQNAINAHGTPYGWQKRWSDAAHEPWHFTFAPTRVTWRGPDPGPLGNAVDQVEEEESMARGLVLYNADGRIEYHSLDGNGSPWHRFMQRDGKWSGWRKFGGGPFVEFDGGRHPDGHLEVFARTRGQITWHNWQNGPNGSWQGSYRQF